MFNVGFQILLKENIINKHRYFKHLQWKLQGFWFYTGAGEKRVSILAALDKLVDKDHIMKELNSIVCSDKAHRAMVKCGVAYLIDMFGK